MKLLCCCCVLLVDCCLLYFCYVAVAFGWDAQLSKKSSTCSGSDVARLIVQLCGTRTGKITKRSS